MNGLAHANQNKSNFLAVNIPADGLFLAILRKANGDLSESNCTRIIKEYISRYLEAKPDTVLLNVCYRRCLTPSEVFDSYLYDVQTDENGFALKNEDGTSVKTLSPTSQNVSKYFASFFTCARVLLQNGIDIYKTAVTQIRAAGCKVLLSIRMNDWHYIDDPAVNSAFTFKNDGMYTINQDSGYLDFSQLPVQNHIYEYIQELLETYRVDGIELDWLRHPTALPQDKCKDYSILNGYMRRIRTLLDRHDPSLCLAVRVLANEQDNLDNGMDASQWIADGSADMITVENFYIPTNYEIPVSQWRDSIAKRNAAGRAYRLLCGSDWAVSCVLRYQIAMSPALVRGFTEQSLRAGADGVYLFNFFEENDTSSFEFATDSTGVGYLKNCFLERMQAAKEPDKLPRRYVHIGSSNERYPIAVAAEGSYTWYSKIPNPVDKLKLTMGLDVDVPCRVWINGNFQMLSQEPVCAGFEYILEEEIGNRDFIYAVSQTAPYVKSCWLPKVLLSQEEIAVTIQNDAQQAAHIVWLEISCE